MEHKQLGLLETLILNQKEMKEDFDKERERQLKREEEAARAKHD